jgi:hypothetical protein
MRWGAAVLLYLMAAASTCETASAQSDCSMLFSTGLSDSCIVGGATNIVVYTPQEDMQLGLIRVPNSSSEITVADLHGELASVKGDGTLDRAVTLRGGGKYFFTIRSSGCPQRSKDAESPSGEKSWKTEYSDCKDPPCAVAVQLYGPGCDGKEQGAEHGKLVGLTILEPPAASNYLGVISAALALALLAYHIGRVRGRDEAIEMIVNFNDVKVNDKASKKLAIK